MSEEEYLRDAGQDLAEFADLHLEGEPRSRSEVLFPYIFEASKKMSTRAISQWLERNRGIKFSAVSVSKVLRNRERYFRKIAERVQPIAEHLAHSYGLDVGEMLFGKTPPFEELDPTIATPSSMHVMDSMHHLEESENQLNQEWFSLGSEVQARAYQYFEFAPEEEDDDE